MLPYFSEHFGNPASRQHAYGWEAQKAVDAARAAGRGADRRRPRRDRLHQRRQRVEQPGDQGRSRTRVRDRGDHIITVRHRAQVGARLVQAPRARRLPRHAARRRRRGIRRSRRAARGDYRPHRSSISIMAANNEIGVLQPLARDWRHRAGARRRSSTPTRRRPRARCRSTSRDSASICCR